MFSLTEEFARAQFDYARERLAGQAQPRRDQLAKPRHGKLVAMLARRRQQTLRPSMRHG